MASWVHSWWDGTPWEEIERDARLALSPRQFAEWLKRPDVIERQFAEFLKRRPDVIERMERG